MKKRAKRERVRAEDGKLNAIGSRIRELRHRLVPKASQEDIAGRLAARGVMLDSGALYKIERGTRAVKDIEIIALARALRVKIQELFE